MHNKFRKHASRARNPLALLVTSLALAGCSGGGGNSSGVAATPQSVVIFPGDTEITVTWAQVPGALTYTIYWDTTPNLSIQTAQVIAGVTPPFLHQGLTNGSDYYYRVTATAGGGEGTASAEAWGRPRLPLGAYDPPWALVAPTQIVNHDYDPLQTPAQNAANLIAAIGALVPGDRLELGSGTWVLDAGFSIDLYGTALAPIWIAARAGALPVFTRSNAAAAVVEVGGGGTGGSRFVALEGIEVHGGDQGISLVDAREIWINLCHVHHTGGSGIAAETFVTTKLFITRNQVNDPAGTGRGIILGGPNETFPSSTSIVAMNHVLDCNAAGIVFLQGTNDSIIAENEVHDTYFQTILVEGTHTLPWNLIERNTCYNSVIDNVVEVQSQAWVRNNLMINGNQGFSSHDANPPTPNGVVQELEFVHNTVINSGRCVNLSGWDNRPGLVFANNVIYSQTELAVRFGNGSVGVVFSGNTYFGTLFGVTGPTLGTESLVGIADFVGASWNGVLRDTTPAPGSVIIGSGDGGFETVEDLRGMPRVGLTVEAGCIDVL